jgi:hypothetical protein
MATRAERLLIRYQKAIRCWIVCLMTIETFPVGQGLVQNDFVTGARIGRHDILMTPFAQKRRILQ